MEKVGEDNPKSDRGECRIENWQLWLPAVERREKTVQDAEIDQLVDHEDRGQHQGDAERPKQLLDHRPSQVKLLLRGQRPHDSDVARLNVNPVRGVSQKEGQSCKVTPRRGRTGLHQEVEKRQREQHQVIDRKDSERAPGVKLLEADTASPIALPQQEGHDQEATEHEEHIDPEEASFKYQSVQPPGCVMPEDGQDAQTAHAIQGGERPGAEILLMSFRQVRANHGIHVLLKAAATLAWSPSLPATFLGSLGF